MKLEFTQKCVLSDHLLKLLDRLIRNDVDLDDITVRVDLLNVEKDIEEILKNYQNSGRWWVERI